MFIPIWILIAFAAGQDYASEVLYPDDLIPVEDREGTLNFYFAFLTFLQMIPVDRSLYQQQQLRRLQLLLFWIRQMFKKVMSISFHQWLKIYLVKYGTLTCGDGFIRLDIYSKDIMLTVCFGIFILQGKNEFSSKQS